MGKPPYPTETRRGKGRRVETKGILVSTLIDVRTTCKTDKQSESQGQYRLLKHNVVSPFGSQTNITTPNPLSTKKDPVVK